MRTGSLRNAMSVDVEDWFHVGAFEGILSRQDWPEMEHRVERNTDAVLGLFAEAGINATFFTLGWVAERYPRLIRRIVDQGHEIANHGWDHRRVFTMNAAEFRDDLRRSRAAIEQAAGQRVSGYRAPSFSIDQRSPWAHAELAEAGYDYSSSVAPIRHDHYGWPETPRFAWRPLSDAALVELPVTTVHFLSRRIAAGGGFFRLLPYGLFRSLIEQVNRDDRQPAIFYFHPWEIDPDQPRMNHASIRSRLRHYTNLGRMQGKLRHLIQDFSWGRMDDVFCVRSLPVAA